MNITLLTLTGDRPYAFSLCEKYMARQTRKWDQWIVLDDCDPPTLTTMDQEIYYPRPKWTPASGNTILRNLSYAMEYIKGDYIFFIEDDDWYHPQYLEKYSQILEDNYDITGEIKTYYYNVRKQTYLRHNNVLHSSLFQTAMKTSLFRMIPIEYCRGPLYDMYAWNYANTQHLKRYAISDMIYSIGIKGMEGRPGVVGYHTNPKNWGTKDPTWLENTIGKDDADNYLRFIKR
jgi:glycosyltransferase involved in cell wall biosynthesis